MKKKRLYEVPKCEVIRMDLSENVADDGELYQTWSTTYTNFGKEGNVEFDDTWESDYE